VVNRFIDALRTGDVATAAECFDADRYYSHAFEADLAGTWEQMKAGRRSRTWTDVEVEPLAVVADGDRVARHAVFTATHTGEFFGVPASGRRVSIPSLEIWRVADGRIVEHWGGLQVTEHLLDRLRAG
jgi:steroid delta-isomerase-like uncharacterized protein